MPAINAKIWLALRGHLETLVLNPAQGIKWPNEVSSIDGAHLEVRHLLNRPERLTIGGPVRHRHIGIFQVDSYYPLAVAGEDSAATYAAEIAGLVAEHFPTDLVLVKDGAKVRITEYPDVSQGFRDETRTMWRTPVSIRYECFAGG